MASSTVGPELSETLALDNARLRRAVERAEKRGAALAALGQQALGGMDYGQLAQSAAETLANVMAVPLVEVLQLMPNRNRLLLVGGIGWQAGLIGTATVKAGRGSHGGYTLTTVGPVVLDDLAHETRFSPSALLADHGAVSGLTVLIGSPARPYGVLGTHSTEHRVFADDDVNFLQAVANVLGAAIERQNDDDRLNALALAEQARAAQLRAVIKSIGDAVVVCDAKGAVLLTNPAAEALLGERIAGGLDEILAAFEAPSDGISSAALPVDPIELSMPADEGADPRWMELSAFPVLGEGTAIGAGGTVLLMRDVTSARNARSVRDAFLGVLSHELRTPVTTIYGGSAVLTRPNVQLEDVKKREMLEDIRSEADRLYRLVENLLVLSRIERQGLQIETEPVLLQRLVPRVTESESTRWPLAQWINNLPAGLPSVDAEETYVEQVLRNLLSNAAKYGGTGPITISAVDEGDKVRVSVADAGPGFPPDEARALFELFYRSPSAVRRASGAGIGLFVSRQLVEAMGGGIWASNLPSGGSEFAFELPVFQDR